MALLAEVTEIHENSRKNSPHTRPHQVAWAARGIKHVSLV